MIFFTHKLPFLFLFPCSSAVLPEPPSSRSPSGLGEVEPLSSFPLRFVTTPPSTLILSAGNHRRDLHFIKHPPAKQGLYFTILKLTRCHAKTKET